MSVANGFGPSTFSIKFGPGFTDDLPSGKQFVVYLDRTGSSSPVAGELLERSFKSRKVCSASIHIGRYASNPMSHAFPIKVFSCLTFLRRKFLHPNCQLYDGFAFSSVQQMGSSGQQMGNIVVVHP